MAKQKKKGQAGQAKNYVTRTQAVRKLQISLPDFRRLCIFKGIYPREPRNIKKANKSATHSTTFYYTKDIQYLLHEPLLAKLRDQKSLQKKIARSLGRNEVQDAMRLDRKARPKMKLDHIVRERYPTFVDALRDLDDALSLLFLFASLPSTETAPPKVIAKCQRLCHEFEHYLITTNSLRKSFLSIKGIYYQATIQGQDIMWLVPYKFVQRVTGDVDYRIMGTFVEFYCTLLGFVNYRLYSSIGLVYPPKFDMVSDENGAELAAFTLEGRAVADKSLEAEEPLKAITNGHTHDENTAEVQAAIDRIETETVPEDALDVAQQPTEDSQEPNTIDKFEPAAPGSDELPQPEISGNEAAALFSDFTFFISREAPRHPIEFLARAFGCKRVGWDQVLGAGAFTHDEQDPRITHQIVDRPAVIAQQNGEQTNGTAKPARYVAGRIYVQPQWIWDCANEARLIRTDLYAPGATLPPHLSPWMKPTKGQYDPRATLEEQQLEGEEDETDEDEIEALENDQESASSGDEEDTASDNAGMKIDVGSSDSEDDETEDENDDFAGFNEEEDVDGEVDPTAIHEAELAAEAAGNRPSTKASPSRKETKRRERSVKEKQEAEDLERRKMMMSNKKRKLFEKMQHSNDQKDAEAKALRQKRRKIEKKR